MLSHVNITIYELEPKFDKTETYSNLVLDTEMILDDTRSSLSLFVELMKDIKYEYEPEHLAQLWFVMAIRYLDYTEDTPVFYTTTKGKCHYHRFRIDNDNALIAY